MTKAAAGASMHRDARCWAGACRRTCRNKPGKANRIIMKTRINLAFDVSHWRSPLIGATLTMAQQAGRDPKFLRPGRKAHVTSTPPPATLAWPPTAPRARCTPPTTARSTRSCASRTARPWTSASSSPSRGPDAGGYADAAAQDAFCANTYCWITTVYDQSPQAQRPHPGASRRIQRPGHGWV